MITVTENACNKIRDLLEPLGAGAGLRIELRPGGCSGTYYHFTISERRPDDMVVGYAGAPVLLAPDVARMVSGAKLDYGPTLRPPRFRVLKNPNTPVRCPCGRSFGSPFPGKTTPMCQAYTPMEWDKPSGEGGT